MYGSLVISFEWIFAMTIPRRTLLRVCLSTELMGVEKRWPPRWSSPYNYVLDFLPLLDLEEISFSPTQLPWISTKYPVVKMEREREREKWRNFLIKYNYIWPLEKNTFFLMWDKYSLLESIKWTPFFLSFLLVLLPLLFVLKLLRRDVFEREVTGHAPPFPMYDNK